MNELTLNYRLKIKVRAKGKDYCVETVAKKVSRWENIGKKGPFYYLNFGEIEINVGEDLMEDIFEILLYMLPEITVRKMLEAYCNSRWV
ncbi:hypothetical protein DRP04_11595 [Archaeoglobales archaeon]|nr:MAG: hypothetical protein DRP04_11595 [Archaeoglobales archaeon]